jgi:DNA-binding MarR family transcriptional regulator
MKLTPKQKHFYDYIANMPKSDVAPTYRDIAIEYGTTLSNVCRYMRVLKERGFIDFLKGRARSWDLKNR